MDTPQEQKFYIVTPSLNAATTIERTIYSIINQQNIPFIRYHIQDGGSTDGTQDIIIKIDKIIKNNPARYSHIHFSWSSTKDSGMYDAIAKGFAEMDIPSTSFMGWLNADDILFPNALQNILCISSNLPEIQWLGGVHCVIDEEDNIISKRLNYYFYPQEIVKSGCCDGTHWAYIQQEGSFWKKSLWDYVQGLNVNFRFAGDWDLWRRMAQHTCFVYCPVMLGAFRRRPGQLSSQPGYQEELDHALSLKERQKYLRYFLHKHSRKLFKKLEYQNGTWQLFETAIDLSIKNKIILYLNALSCTKTVNFLCKLYSTLKRS